MRTPRRREMPSEDEIIRSQLFQLHYVLTKMGPLVKFFWESEEYDSKGDNITREFELVESQEFTNELHPQVHVYLREVPRAPEVEGESATEERSEGAVPSQRSDEQLRTDAPASGRSDLDTGSAEGSGGRTVRESTLDSRD